MEIFYLILYMCIYIYFCLFVKSATPSIFKLKITYIMLIISGTIIRHINLYIKLHFILSSYKTANTPYILNVYIYLHNSLNIKLYLFWVPIFLLITLIPCILSNRSSHLILFIAKFFSVLMQYIYIYFYIYLRIF